VKTELNETPGDLKDYSPPDELLVAAIRCDPLDLRAMDTLIERYWRRLFARCTLLCSNRDDAYDLAQETWCRILRARHRLRSDGHFAAYLMTIATNLWRDRQRAEIRAGMMADRELISLDKELQSEGEVSARWSDILPDPSTLPGSEKALLKLSLDEALSLLNPLLRDVIVSKYIAGESCAEIGARYGRTEQTITGWIRKAIHELRRVIDDRGGISRFEPVALGI
jgi:RNA polymerase sigma-70 factor, ECF subfamily